MSDFFIGQILIGGFNFPPRGFAACNGALLPINQYSALYALLGTAYGGDGVTTFALPDLRGRTAVGFAPSRDAAWQPPVQAMGATGGEEQVALSLAEMPMHVHTAMGAAGPAGTKAPTSATVFAASAVLHPYGPDSGALVGLASATLSTAGSSAAHPNLQPLNTLNFNIATTGLWPSRS